MSGKFTALKNIVWALCILVCLLAVAVGLVISSVNRSSSPVFETEIDLRGEKSNKAPTVSDVASADASAAMRLTESADMGQAYIDRLTFLCDSCAIGMRDYGLLSGGKETYQVWGTDTGFLRMSELINTEIIYPADGSSISIADAALLAKPEILVVMIGQDGLGETDESVFKANYQAVLTSIKSSSPDTVIICCSISSISDNYTGADALTVEKIDLANVWIQSLCAENGAYFCNTAGAVGDGGDFVKTAYLSTNGKTLNSAGITELLGYLRTHALT